MKAYWEAIDAQLRQLKTAPSADAVITLCPHVPDLSSGNGWWGGDGDDMLGALYDAGWRSVDVRASYHWCLKAPDESMLTYVEGDLYRGNTMPKER